MKATVGYSHTSGPAQVPFIPSLIVSLGLHGIFVLWLFVSAWFLGQPQQPYRLAEHTVFLAGDSPIADMPGEGGGATGKYDGKEPGAGGKTPAGEGSPESAAEHLPPLVEKPSLSLPSKAITEKAAPAPPSKPVVEKAAPPPPKPVVEKAAPPPPKPVVEKVTPPPAPKPVVEKVAPAPSKPPPEAMTLAQKDAKQPPQVPPATTSTEAQQKITKMRERQSQQENTEVKVATEVQQKVAKLREQQARQEADSRAAQQRVASLRSEQADKQAAEQRLAALRSRVGSGSSTGEGSGTSASGTGGSGPGSGAAGSGPGAGGGGSGSAGVGAGSGAPGGGRGTGVAGSGGYGTGGLAGIRLRSYQDRVREKITNAWGVPPQSQGLQAVVFLVISRTGHVEQMRLVQRSGNPLFDESLQRAVRQAQPLPPLPDDYSGGFLEVELRFRPRG